MEIRYLYVKYFKWNDAFEAERRKGHLWEGRVYRAWYNDNTKGYLINCDADNSFLTNELVIKEEDATFNCNLIPLTKSNILEHNIKEEDLDNIIAWDKSGNEDIKINLAEELNPNEQVTPINKVIQQAVENHRAENEAMMDKAYPKLLELLHLNTTHFEIVLDVIDYLIENNIEEVDELTMTLAQSKNGMAWNIGNALKLIQRYSSQDRRTNGEYEDVVKAVVSLVNELERKLINEED